MNMTNGYPTYGYGVSPTPGPTRNNVAPMYDTNCNFIYVDSPRQVTEFIVNPNQTRYFMDNNEPYMYIKSADQTGITKTDACKLEKVDFDSLINPAPAPIQNGVSKEDFDNLIGMVSALAKRIDDLEQPKEIIREPLSKTNPKYNKNRRDGK